MRFSGVSRTAVAAVAALTMSGVVAGCGSSGTHADGGHDTGGQAAKASTSPQPATNVSLTRSNFVPKVQAALKAKKSVHMTMSMPGQMHAVGDANYPSGQPQLQMTMSVADKSMEMRFLDGALYLKAPGMGLKGKFVKFTKDSPMVGQMIGKIESFGPNGSLATMKDGLKNVKDVGSTSIDGMSVEHYKVTVDTSAALKRLGVPKAQLRQVPQKMTEDMYVGPGNLLRRTVVDVMGHRMTVDLTRWGKPVHITAPPASKVVEMPKNGMPGSPSTSTGGASANS